MAQVTEYPPLSLPFHSAQTMETGFEKERIEAVLHQIELSQRDQTTSFGLGVAAAVMVCCLCKRGGLRDDIVRVRAVFGLH